MLGVKLGKERFPRVDLFFPCFCSVNSTSNFAANTKISKGREGGMGVYTQIPAVPNKRPAEGVRHTPLLPGGCIASKVGLVF